MPELAEAVTTVYRMGFLDPAVDLLRHYGIIDREKYSIIKDNIKEKTEENVRKTISGIEKYTEYKKAAGIVSGISGILLLIASSTKITGGIIGSPSNTITGIIGTGLILLSLILLIKSFKKR